MLLLYEGKMIWHFTANYAAGRYWVDETEGRIAVAGRGGNPKQPQDFEFYRFGFRSITGNTNERTLVCSIIPKCVFCGNSLIVSKRADNSLTDAELLFLDAVMSSYVIDFSLRSRVATQLNMFFVYQTPVPRYRSGDPYFDSLVSRAVRLICNTPEFDDLAREIGLRDHTQGIADEVARGTLRAEIDGIVAHLYGLTEEEFAHILSTFPLVPEPIKIAARNAYRDVERGLIN
jgi:hypothetical protein